MKIEVPGPGQDRPELGRVGVIAAVGFAIGVAWPWLAGVRLVPDPPIDEERAVASPSSSPAASAPAETESAAPALTTELTVKIGEPQVTGCHDGKKKATACDSVDFARVAKGPLAALTSCDAAKGTRQRLSIGFDLDFQTSRVTDIFAGKSTTFSREKTKELVDCARSGFESVRLDGIEHEHERYTVFFFLEFVPPGTPIEVEGAAPADEETIEASGLATVSWDVAIVRSQPDGGSIVTRLRYGTRVVVVARRGNWYEVKYDAKGRRGWVHKNAIGL